MPVYTLEYHDVVAGDAWGSSGFAGNSADSYKMSAERFEAHLAAVAAIANDTGRDVREIDFHAATAPIVLFTFDDGGVSAAHVSAGLLEHHGFRGHFLMTTSRIGSPGFLSAGELRELHGRGHVVGSHSESHPPRMSRLSRDEQIGEWARSRAALEQVLGAPVEVASVPGGYFDRQAASAAAEAGIRWLFTSEPESEVETVDGCVVIGRYTLRQTSSAALASGLVCTGGSARASQWLKWNAKKLAKRAAGDSYLRLRAAIFRDGANRNGHENR